MAYSDSIACLKLVRAIPKSAGRDDLSETCLRLADIMDFDRSRTPLALLETITDETAQAEWQKHLQIRGWDVTERDVAFHARCTDAQRYVSVMEFPSQAARQVSRSSRS